MPKDSGTNCRMTIALRNPAPVKYSTYLSMDVPEGKPIVPNSPGKVRRNRSVPFSSRLLCLLLFLCAGVVPARGDFGRPAPERGPTRVTVTVVFLDVAEINSARQSFTGNIYTEVRWRDERLAHKGRAPLWKDLHSVWNPRLQIVNRRNATLTLPELVEIGPGGDVLYRQRVWGDFSQVMDLRDFPMDRQIYSIRIAAAGYTSEEVELVPDMDINYETEKVLSLPDWKVEEWKADVVTVRGLIDKQKTFSRAVFSFTALRDVRYYVVKVIIPLILIVAMSWVVFWIDPTEGGVQIGVSMSAMLTLIAYRFAVGADLPKVSYVTRMDLFLLGSTVLVFATLLEVVVTSTLARRERLEGARRIDRVARVLFPLLFALVIARSFLL